MSQASGIFPTQTRRVSLTVAGQVFDRWTNVTVDRDMGDIAGTFELELIDSGRVAQSFNPDLDPMPPFAILQAGMACSVKLDGQIVLKGWIDGVEVEEGDSQVHAIVRGRDVTGDLVDCAAAPNGPVEWRGLTVLQIAQAICKPFGISVRADVDVGPAFPVFACLLDEMAMPAIERACRQRALLMVSDGVGGLLLTVGGNSRAPAPLTRPGNIQHAKRNSSWVQRFSDYYVKGQTDKSAQRYGKTPKITAANDPAVAAAADPTTTDAINERSSVLMTGHAIDPQVTRYRPNVRMVSTQSGSASVQAQADWAARVAQGMGETLTYTVLDWRAGSANALWMLNQLSGVTDSYGDLNQDMLIRRVTYRYSEEGLFTELGMNGPTAFDRIDEPTGGKKFLFKRSPKSFGPTRNG